MRTIKEERLRRRQRLAAALRLFARFGFDEGAGGHITVRDPECSSRFWVNPFGRPFARLKVSDQLLVDHQGTVREGDGTVNPAGYAIHSRIHRARPDVVAAAHSHSIYGRALAALGRGLDPITQDACAFFEDQSLYDDFGGVVLDPAEGERIATALGPHKAVVLRNHGLLTVGGSIDEAAWWFISMERCAQVQLVAEAAGKTVPIGEADARRTRDTIGTPALGRLNFRPLYERIAHEEPDLLD